MPFRKTLVGILFSLALSPLLLQAQSERTNALYYDKWLKEDVIYIITEEEKAVFRSLTTDAERDAFIEQFWARRDNTLGGHRNEFKEEHYRRIAYANRYFGSGIPGWKTDRGRIYIAFGEPAEIEDHSAGGTYQRKVYEGGGRTVTYPFQVWRYRFLEGIGDDIEIEFVDRSLTGEYKLTTNPDDKDVLLRQDGEGLTLAEKVGLANKNLRYSLHPGNATNIVDQKRRGMRAKDAPFERMNQFFNLQRPPSITYKDLKAIVDTKVTYNLVPFSYVAHHFWIDGERAIVPFSVELDNSNLEFEKFGNIYKASVSLYGLVTALNGRVVAEFEDRIAAEYPEDIFEIGRKKKSIYQKPLGLAPGTYKLELVLKDLKSERMGTLTTRLAIPRFDDEKLMASPILLARELQQLRRFPDALERFVIGDVKAVPNVDQKFRKTDYLGVYMQAYNPQIDVATEAPALTVRYRLKQDGELLTEQVDEEGASVDYFSEQRIVLVRRLPLRELPPGKYSLEIQIRDRISGQEAVSGANFEIIP